MSETTQDYERLFRQTLEELDQLKEKIYQKVIELNDAGFPKITSEEVCIFLNDMIKSEDEWLTLQKTNKVKRVIVPVIKIILNGSKMDVGLVDVGLLEMEAFPLSINTKSKGNSLATGNISNNLELFKRAQSSVSLCINGDNRHWHLTQNVISIFT